MTDPIDARLPRDPSCSSRARSLINERFGAVLSEDTRENLKLVTTELVNNAYVHGSGEIRLKIQSLEDRVRVEVKDEGEGTVLEIKPLADARGGYGLRLVDRVSLRWGAYEGSTHVWADLPLDAA